MTERACHSNDWSRLAFYKAPPPTIDYRLYSTDAQSLISDTVIRQAWKKFFTINDDFRVFF